MQTWEYAPQFALRTYFYLYPLVAVSKIYSVILPVMPLASMLVSTAVTQDRMALFILLRATLAGTMGWAEVSFLKAIAEQVPFHQSLDRQPLVTHTVSTATAVLLLTCAGMGHAAGALLPSSCFLLAWLVGATAYVRQQRAAFVVVAVTATLAIGWPFGVMCLAPMGLHILWTARQPVQLLLGTLLYTILAQAAVMAVDYRCYGQLTLATYNIFRYNAQGGGDELYGVEPVLYYIKNAALNFNYLAALALLILPVCMLRRICGHPLPTPFITLTGSLYMWLAMVVPRPHKEERFLFPIYAIVCLSAVVVVEQLWLTVVGKTRRPYWMLLLIPSSLLGVSRTMALSRYYTAPLAVYGSIAPTATGLVCTCGEWYRFPSSFMLPSDTRLAFVKSSFTGQLPKQFESTKVGNNFNDANTEETDRYVALSECAYVVELDEPGASCTMQMNEGWTKVASYPYLDAAQTSSLHRVLYIPHLHERSKAVHYNSYSLYKQNTGESDMSKLPTDEARTFPIARDYTLCIAYPYGI